MKSRVFLTFLDTWMLNISLNKTEKHSKKFMRGVQRINFCYLRTTCKPNWIMSERLETKTRAHAKKRFREMCLKSIHSDIRGEKLFGINQIKHSRYEKRYWTLRHHNTKHNRKSKRNWLRFKAAFTSDNPVDSVQFGTKIAALFPFLAGAICIHTAPYEVVCYE